MALRVRILSVISIILFVLLVWRLFYLQILSEKNISDSAKKQHWGEKKISAGRGSIYARDNSLLTAGSTSWLLYAEIPKIDEDDKLPDRLAPLLVEDPANQSALFEEAGRLKNILNEEKLVWVPLKKRISDQTKKNIEAMELNGLGFDEEEIRSYPEASVAAHVLGFYGKNTEGSGQGYFGLEGYYDLILAGNPGLISREVDVKGRPIAIGDNTEVEARDGISLVTNIDKGIQIMAEKKLAEGIQKYEAKAGSVTVVEPDSGAVLAMSSYPNYNPANYWEYSNELFKNPVVSDSFEPGSIFKILVIAAALDAGVINADTRCDICGDPLKIDKYQIETWNNKYYENSNMTDIIVHSDNVGMVFVGQKLGQDLFYDYLKKFGFGTLTGIDLQGEVSPKLRDKNDWNIVDLATASFGQGIAVTPIQMIRAACIIANKGTSVTPKVVKKLVQGNWEEEVKLQKQTRVISQKAAVNVTAMMVEAAQSGESKWTALSGFRVAGKTGTAQIPLAGHYDEEKTIASFIGFAPAEDPKFVMLVTLREPQSSPWASETAAPLWYNIAKDLFMYYGISPEK